MIFPVIMCGGVGSRLWPVSRSAHPKQFLPLTSRDSMLMETIRRAAALEGAQPPVLLCNAEHRFLAALQAQEAGAEGAAVILEPEGRNTAPAVALAALHIARHNPDAIMTVLAADHAITRPEAYHEAMGRAVAAARSGALATLGITPDKPHTGYGYIKLGAPSSTEGAMCIERFVEKPDRATAEAFLDEGGYLWNSGMFVMRADRYLEELGRHAPDILDACRAAMAGVVEDLDFLRPDPEAFLACRADSIDYAVMEHCDNAVVAPCDLGWSDVGCWSQLWQIGEKDAAGNVVVGDTLLEDVRGSYLRSDDKLLAVIGMEDVTVVSTSDAVLVAPRNRAQDVKALIDRMKREGRSEVDDHVRVYRPWGYYEGVHNGGRHQVKHIEVKPGARLSLQKHFHRSEHWVVVRGTAIVTRDEEELLLTENQSVYLPLGCVHRLENPGKVPLSIVEVQTGAYLGEDDIVRFEDVYNRAGD